MGKNKKSGFRDFSSSISREDTLFWRLFLVFISIDRTWDCSSGCIFHCSQNQFLGDVVLNRLGASGYTINSIELLNRLRGSGYTINSIELFHRLGVSEYTINSIELLNRLGASEHRKKMVLLYHIYLYY